MASITIGDDNEIPVRFTLEYYSARAPVSLHVGSNELEVIITDLKDGGKKFTFEYFLYESKLILRRMVNGFYDENAFPDIVIWQK